jgi:shikimate dehydrogenase
MGEPIRHSLSPVLHNAAFRALDLDWVSIAYPVAEGDAKAAVGGIRALGLEGMSVTMPHKAAVIPAVDKLSPTAKRLGAVNTIVRRGSQLLGESTDGSGFLDALRADEGFDPSGKRCVVLGSGGAARAVVLALAEVGASEVVVVGRTAKRVKEAAKLAGKVGRVGQPEDAKDADLLVNGTPVGMAGIVRLDGSQVEGKDLPIDPNHIASGQWVVDLVYHPLVTPLVSAARAQGAKAVNGLGMLIHQAAHAFRLWTGEEAPLEVMSAAALATLSHRTG